MSSQNYQPPSFPIIINALLAWILLLPLLPFIFSFLVSLAFYRVVVLVSARLFKFRNLVKPATGLDISFSTDNFYEKPHGANAFIHVVEGKLSPELIIDRLEKVFEENKSTNGYEKLTSVIPVFWMGYLFWKRVIKQFDVRNHIKVMAKDDFGFTRMNELNKLLCEWMRQPFVTGLPLWEIRVLPEITLVGDEISFPSCQTIPKSCSPSTCTLNSKGLQTKCHCEAVESTRESELKSILVLKTHHVIGDGNSMLRILESIYDADCMGRKPKENGATCSRFLRGMQNSKNTFDFSSQSNSNLLEMSEVHEQKSLGKKKMSFFHLLGRKQEHHEGIIVKMDDSVRKVERTTTFTSEERKNVDPSKFSILAKSFKSSIIKVWMKGWTCIGEMSRLKGVKNLVKEGSLQSMLSYPYQILLVFLTPLSLLILVKEFAIHRDCWLTKKKESNKLNLATVCISMKWLNLIRKDLCNPYPNLPIPNSQNELPAKRNFSEDGNDGIPCGSGNASHVNTIKRYQDECSPLKPTPLVIIAVSAFAGALAKWIRGRNGKGNDGTSETVEGSCPPSANFVVALPLRKRHPGTSKFCNFWTHGILKVKMSEFNSLRRLQSLSKYYWEMRSHQSPEIYHSLVRFHSVLPEPILRLIANFNMSASIGVTNLMGSPNPVYIGGQRVLRKFAYFGPQWRHASMTLALVSYDGVMNATVLANESVIPTQRDVEKVLKDYFMNELKRLKSQQDLNLQGHLQEENGITLQVFPG